MLPDLRAAVVEHKAELLAVLTDSGALRGGDGFNRNDVAQADDLDILGQSIRGLGGENVDGKAGNEAQARIQNVEGPAVRQVNADRQEGFAVQFTGEDFRGHAGSVHHNETDLQPPSGAALPTATHLNTPMPHADREIARFLRVAVPDPDGSGWHDPASRAPVVKVFSETGLTG